MGEVLDHNHPVYRRKWIQTPEYNRYNGAFYYSKEIVENIIPNVKTDRNWVTIRVGKLAYDHSIIFIHNNLNPDRYEYLSRYEDLVLVCGIQETMNKIKHLGKTIYLPLSVDVDYVKQFMVSKEKRKGAAYVGRLIKKGYNDVKLPIDIDVVGGIKRQKLLSRMANYKQVYAVGRTAIEAKVLGCEVKEYDPRFPDPSVWKILDNKDAAVILQKELDAIDGVE